MLQLNITADSQNVTKQPPKNGHYLFNQIIWISENMPEKAVVNSKLTHYECNFIVFNLLNTKLFL